MTDITLPESAALRTLVRHERGTMLTLIIFLLAVMVVQTAWLVHLMRHDQIYSAPDIYREQDVTIEWGGHAG